MVEESAPSGIVAMDATSIIQSVRGGDLTVREVALATLGRIAERDEQVRAWAHLDPDRVIAQAEELDARAERGPLHGIPVALKDVIDTADMPTTHNTPRYAASRPGVDAACVDVLRASGALIVGKATTTEFAATGVGGPTRNPHDPARTPGGSSSGSAAAVADGQSVIALGTQTGGSMIRPGSFTGVFAWKPTWGVISREGVKFYSVTCDTVGFYARSARDLALLADVYRLDAARTAPPTELAGVRVGVCRTPEWAAATDATRAALAVAEKLLRAAGADVAPFELPASFEDVYRVHRAIMRREGRSAFLNEYLQTPHLGEFFRELVEDRPSLDPNGRTSVPLGPEGYRIAYRQADALRAELDDLQAGLDVVLAPSAPGEAPLGLASTGSSVFNSLWTLMQVPVVNVPGLRGSSGMPVGVSLIGRRFEDRALIGVADLVGSVLGGAAH